MDESHKTLRLKVSSIEGLFDSQDPRDIPERNLNFEWLEYIFEVMNDKPGKYPIDLDISAKSIGEEWDIETLPDVLHEEFKNYDVLLRRRLKDNFRLGRTSLLIALMTLAGFILLSELVHLVSTGFFQRAFEEGFLIIGWVALWRPVEILLYDWWPIVDRRRKVRRIIAGNIKIRES